MSARRTVSSAESRPPIGRGDVLWVAALALALGAAPTVGDVGSCGHSATELDMKSFAAQRKATDCQRCTACGLDTNTCKQACSPSAAPTASWPPTCHPLTHDGAVCIRALQASGCDDYASFVDDAAPTLPTECDFCHEATVPSEPVGDL